MNQQFDPKEFAGRLEIVHPRLALLPLRPGEETRAMLKLHGWDKAVAATRQDCGRYPFCGILIIEERTDLWGAYIAIAILHEWNRTRARAVIGIAKGDYNAMPIMREVAESLAQLYREPEVK